MNCEVPVRALYGQLLEGALDGEARATFAAHIGACCDLCDEALGDIDEAERDLVLSLLWADAGGHDAELPDFDASRALAAALAGMHRRQGDNVLSFTRPAVWLSVAAAAAAILLLMRPISDAPADLQARGAAVPVLGEAIDLIEWAGEGRAGRPVLTGDSIASGATLALEWTNPPRADGAWRHLSLVAGTGGDWRVLDQRAIGVVAEDEQSPVAGPVRLDLPPGEVEVCGVFSRTRPPAGALAEGRSPGPRVCTKLKVR